MLFLFSELLTAEVVNNLCYKSGQARGKKEKEPKGILGTCLLDQYNEMGKLKQKYKANKNLIVAEIVKITTMARTEQADHDKPRTRQERAEYLY